MLRNRIQLPAQKYVSHQDDDEEAHVRLLFVGIAFLLIDLRLYLLWGDVSYPRRGGQVIIRVQFPLKRMLEFLRQEIDRKYHTKDTIFL